jgi:hypothetical protein
MSPVSRPQVLALMVPALPPLIQRKKAYWSWKTLKLMEEIASYFLLATFAHPFSLRTWRRQSASLDASSLEGAFFLSSLYQNGW